MNLYRFAISLLRAQTHGFQHMVPQQQEIPVQRAAHIYRAIGETVQLLQLQFCAVIMHGHHPPRFCAQVNGKNGVVGRFMKVQTGGEPLPPGADNYGWLWNLSLIE